MSHSPGPWSAYENHDRHANYLSCRDDCLKTAWRIISDGEHEIAAVYQDDDRADDDACLIAAAPDLAASCSALVAYVRWIGKTDADTVLLKQADDALRKVGMDR